MEPNIYKLKTELRLKAGEVFPKGAPCTVRWYQKNHFEQAELSFSTRMVRIPAHKAGAYLAGIDTPDDEQLGAWVMDSVCESITGDTVEPDGHGPDGAPSWLLALGLV